MNGQKQRFFFCVCVCILYKSITANTSAITDSSKQHIQPTNYQLVDSEQDPYKEA